MKILSLEMKGDRAVFVVEDRRGVLISSTFTSSVIPDEGIHNRKIVPQIWRNESFHPGLRNFLETGINILRMELNKEFKLRTK